MCLVMELRRKNSLTHRPYSFTIWNIGACCKIPATKKGYIEVNNSKIKSSFQIHISLTFGHRSQSTWFESQLCHYLLFFFRAGPVAYGLEVYQSCSCWPTPQPQQRRIQTASKTYTEACCNPISLTHSVNPGIKPTSSRILVGFLTTEPQ